MSLPNLNLLNFEIPQTRNCKYILTSPRSLKACRKAGVRPVDLLYKSLSEVKKELGKDDGAEEIYQAYEKERQRKLALCRKFRNDFILMGFPGRSDLCKKERKITKPSLKTGNTSALAFDEKKSEENKENLKIKDYTSKVAVNSSEIVSSQEISENGIDLVKDEKQNHLLHQTSPTKSPCSPEKSTIELRSTLTMSPPNKLIITPNNPEDIVHTSELMKKECDENFINTDKLSINQLDLVENSLKDANFMSDRDSSINKVEIPMLESNGKGVHFEDINNNHRKVKLLEQRPSLAFRKKLRDKKRLKALEYERLYNNICAQYADPEYCLFKYKQVIENSLERELREQEVHRVQRELEEGLERWQDHILILQWLDSLRAQEQASKELEVKVERLQRTARSKNILHTMNYNKIKKDEDIKAELLRRLVEDKERRILNLHKQKERVICESKSRAQNISELKQQIRNIVMPETFDKKVFKCGLQKKVFNSGAMCPRIMHKSHIKLA